MAVTHSFHRDLIRLGNHQNGQCLTIKFISGITENENCYRNELGMTEK